jgi:predicted nucleic acid-binding protein
VIVDASVALKWVIREADSALALKLLARTDLVAPSLLTVEVGYVLTKLARQRTLSTAQALTAWTDFRTLPLLQIEDTTLWQAAFDLSLRLGASFYDCAYLALAQIEGDVLVTADQRFIRAARSAPRFAATVLSLAEAAR